MNRLVHFIFLLITSMALPCWCDLGALRQAYREGALAIFPEKKRMGTWKIPLQNQWVGFDFARFDWVAPYGKGINTDVLLRFSAETSRQIHGRYQMEVCFTNNPFAGAYVGSGDVLSDLKIPHRADSNETYRTYFCFKRDNFDGARIDTFPKENDYLVFRTRTSVGADGKLLRACYGVITGVWVSSETQMRIEDAAFNTEANDLCIEDGYYLRRLLNQYDHRRRNE